MNDAKLLAPDGEALPARGHPYSFAYRLHAGGIGFVALCCKREGDRGKFEQTLHKFLDLMPRLSRLNANGDWYLSVNAFSRRARKARFICSLRANFLDLDTYKTARWAASSPEDTWDGIKCRLLALNFPLPQVAVFSGRGIQIFWIFSRGLPPSVGRRWSAVQKELARAFKEFGADVGALDAARVVRLPGTVNTKSGHRAYFLHYDDETSTDFEELATKVLPVDRGTIRERRRQPQEKRESGAAVRKSSAAVYRETMLADIRQLIDCRWSGRIPVGHRNKILFVYATFLVRRIGMATLAAALVEFGQNVCDLDQTEIEQIAESVEEKCRADGVGYAYSAIGAAGQLGVTSEEAIEFGLKRLHPRDTVLEEQRRRLSRNLDRARKRATRLGEGMRPHSESVARKKPWTLCGISRATWYRRLKSSPRVPIPQIETDLSNTTVGGTPSNKSEYLA